MIFAAVCVALLIVGRKVGWFVSRRFLYPSDSNVAVGVLCVAWGLLIAFGMRELIVWQHPQWALKYFLGYGVGGYVAYPAYGLVQEASIPAHAQFRHSILETVPILTYIAASVLFAFVL